MTIIWGISHVTRGKEWLPSVPRHVQLYGALGWDMPKFAHMPMILAPDKTKLSKRHGAASVTDYREMGVLPEALMNYLALLGWSLDDRTEVFSRDELAESFDLARVSKSDAVFDFDKLIWLNGQHIRMADDERLADALTGFWRDSPPDFDIRPEPASVGKIVPLARERLKTLDDAAPLVRFVFSEEVSVEPEQLVQRGMDFEGTDAVLNAAHDALLELDEFDADSIEGLLRPMAKELDVKVGQLLGTLRAATSGQKVSPPIFESLEVLGRDRTLSRIRDAVAALQESQGGRRKMTLKSRLDEDMKTAMRNRDAQRRDVIRFLRSEIRNQEIRAQDELDDQGVVQVLSRQAQQRRDSIQVFKDAERQDLVEKEEAELAVIMEYLPQQMGAEEITALVEEGGGRGGRFGAGRHGQGDGRADAAGAGEG